MLFIADVLPVLAALSVCPILAVLFVCSVLAVLSGCPFLAVRTKTRLLTASQFFINATLKQFPKIIIF
jgi:hypothetical protein